MITNMTTYVVVKYTYLIFYIWIDTSLSQVKLKFQTTILDSIIFFLKWTENYNKIIINQYYLL